MRKIIIVIGIFIFFVYRYSTISAQNEEYSLGFSTFTSTGSSGVTSREVNFDSQGNILMVTHGGIIPVGYPKDVPVYTYGPIDAANIGVFKFTPDGSRLLWAAFVGGSGSEKGGYGLEVDSNDDIVVAGTTFSGDFYTTSEAWDRNFHDISGSPDAYVFKLSGDGSQMRFSTYLGGSYEDTARGGLALDSSNNIYVAGHTDSADFLSNPSSGRVTKKYGSLRGKGGDGFVLKLKPDGSQVDWMRYIGGTDNTAAESILGAMVDGRNRLYINGYMSSSDAVVGQNPIGLPDGYFAQLSLDGTTFYYSTYYGRKGADYSEHRIDVDPDNNAYVSGFSGGDAYLIKFDANAKVVYEKYFGGSGSESAFGPAVASDGSVWVAGLTQSTDFPLLNPIDSTYGGGGIDAFVQRYDIYGNLVFSSYLGGNGYDYARFIKADGNGNVLIVSETNSSDFPSTPGAFDNSVNTKGDVALTQLTASSPSTPTPTPPNCNIPGDANCDGKVDGFDYVYWLTNFNKNVSGGSTDGDFDNSVYVDGVDYVIWWQNFGS